MKELLPLGVEAPLRFTKRLFQLSSFVASACTLVGELLLKVGALFESGCLKLAHRVENARVLVVQNHSLLLGTRTLFRSTRLHARNFRRCRSSAQNSSGSECHSPSAVPLEVRGGRLETRTEIRKGRSRPRLLLLCLRERLLRRSRPCLSRCCSRHRRFSRRGGHCGLCGEITLSRGSLFLRH